MASCRKHRTTNRPARDRRAVSQSRAGHFCSKNNNHAVYAAHLIHPEFLNGIGGNHTALSDDDLLEVFVDTFLLAVISQTRQFGDPFSDVYDKAKHCCFEYISSISFPEKRSG